MATEQITFGKMLTEGILAIKKCQSGKSIAIIQDELGYALVPERDGRTVERWRYGPLPPTASDIGILAKEIIARSCNYFNREWLLNFLIYAQHPYPEKICDDLFPTATPEKPLSTTQLRESYTTASTPKRLAQLILLNRVRKFWIEGVLEKSLYNHVLLELELQETQDAIAHSWDVALPESTESNQQLLPGMAINDIFAKMNRALLILGEPGSGKTTLLLAFARDMIASAEQDPNKPIPVVFNLSSWTPKQPDFAEWLVDELNIKYHIPQQISWSMIKNNNLLLLLDGLDEVMPTHEQTCVKAINEFRQEYGLTEMIVCSRVTPYQTLVNQLKLDGAVLIQALTSQQIDHYLASTGPQLSNLRALLRHDTVLQEMAKSPLMLYVMSVAYRDVSAKRVTTKINKPTEVHQQNIFAKYTEQMFKRRSVTHSFSPKQTIYWLTWLAQGMSLHSQLLFLIEQLQPSWLQDGLQHRLYTIGSRLFGGLMGFLLGGLISGLFGGLIGKEMGEGYVLARETVIIGGVLGWVIGDRLSQQDHISNVETLKWSWSAVRHRLPLILLGGFLGLAINGLFFVLPFGWVNGLLVALTGGLLAAFVALLAGGLINTEMEMKTFPNHGIWQSGKSALLLGFILGFISWLIFTIFAGFMGLIVATNGQVDTWVLWWKAIDHLSGEALTFGVVIGSMGALRFGGFAFAQHYILRIILYAYGHIPWNCSRFLDYAAERIFMRKVGGGYIFIHQLLLTYFAGLRPQKTKEARIEPPINGQNAQIGKLIRHSFTSIQGWLVTILQLGLILFSIATYGPLIKNKIIATTYNYQANTYRADGEQDQAIQYYNQAITLSPEYAGAFYNRGIAYQSSGEHERALLDFNKAIEYHPENAANYYNRGHSYQHLDELDKALRDYTTTIELDPSYARAYYNRGGIYAQTGDTSKAITNYSHAIKWGLDSATVYYDRGNAYRSSGDPEKAFQDYSMAIKLDKDGNAKAYYYRGQIHGSANRLEEAIQDYDRAIKSGFSNPIIYYNRGRVYLDSGEPQKAIRDYERAIELGITKDWLYYELGRAYQLANELENAIINYQKTIQLDDDNPRYFYALGHAYTLSDNPQEAILHYSTAIEFDDQYARAYHSRGYAYSTVGEQRKAILDFNMAIKLGFDEAATYYGRGYAYALYGNLEEAILNYNKAIVLEPNNIWAHINRGAAYQLLGKTDLAINDFKKVLELSDDPERRKAAQEKIEMLTQSKQ